MRLNSLFGSVSVILTGAVVAACGSDEVEFPADVTATSTVGGGSSVSVGGGGASTATTTNVGGGAVTTTGVGGAAVTSTGVGGMGVGGMGVGGVGVGGMGVGGMGVGGMGVGGMGGGGGGGNPCGNGIIEGTEECDGMNVPATCVDFGFSDPNGVTCSPSCKFDASGCAATCDGILLEVGEVCDGANLGTVDCTDFGYFDPAGATCSANCDGVLPTNCAASCGNIAEPGEECDDGNQNPNDGCTNCHFDGTSCASALALTATIGTPPQAITGSITGGGNHQSNCLGGEQQLGPDRIYNITANADGFLSVWLPVADFDSVLVVKTQCMGNATVDCDDNFDSANGAHEYISIPVTSQQVVTLIVDGWNTASAGSFTMMVDLSAGACGDRVPFMLPNNGTSDALGVTSGQPDARSASCTGAPGGGEVQYRPAVMDNTVMMPTLFNYNVEAIDQTSISLWTGCPGGAEVACRDTGTPPMTATVAASPTVSTTVMIESATAAGSFYRFWID